LSHNLKFEVALVGTAVDYSFLQGTYVIVNSLFSKSEKSMAADLLHMLPQPICDFKAGRLLSLVVPIIKEI
jgi:hypothetical protein